MADFEETTSTESREIRGHYTFSKLPILNDEATEISEKEIGLLTLQYNQVCTTWRSLHDVRFKLLGLVPFVTVAILVVVIPDAGSTTGLSQPFSILIGLIGALTTLGLWIYDQRNSQLYNDLISRARRIEVELGFKNGVFLGRPSSKTKLVSHSPAVFLVYFAAGLGWLSLIVISVLI